MTSIWFVRRTRAPLRTANFGFLGVVVYTRVQTPRRCGAATFFLRPLPDFKPGVASFFVLGLRPLRTNWDVVGIRRRMVAALTPVPVRAAGAPGAGDARAARPRRSRARRDDGARARAASPCTRDPRTGCAGAHPKRTSPARPAAAPRARPRPPSPRAARRARARAAP